MEFGSVAEWGAVLVNIAALGAAVTAWQVSRKLLKVEQGRDKRAEDRAEMEQATLIAAWGITLVDRGSPEMWSIAAQNASSSPVFNVLIESQTLAGKTDSRPNATLALNHLPPGEFITPSAKSGNGWGLPIDRRVLRENYETTMRSKKPMVTRIEFTDCYGQRWQRDTAGNLSKVSA